MINNSSMNPSEQVHVESQRAPSCTNARSEFVGDNLRSEMTALNAAMHYAERISPGVTHRLTVADFAAVHQGTIRSISKIYLDDRPLFGSGSLPELRIGPVTSVLNSMVQNVTSLVNASSRLSSLPEATGPKRPVPGSDKKKSVKKEGGAKPKKEKKQISESSKSKGKAQKEKAPISVAATSNALSSSKNVPQDASKKKEKKKKPFVPLDFIVDLDRDKLLTGDQRKAILDNRAAAVVKPDTRSEGNPRNTDSNPKSKGKGVDVKTAMRTDLFKKVKRSYDSSFWKEACDLSKISLDALKSKCLSLSDPELLEVNKLRASGVPPILALGYFQAEMVSSLDWSHQVDLKDQVDKALRINDRARASQASKRIAGTECLADVIARSGDKKPQYVDFSTAEEFVSPTLIRDELRRILQKEYKMEINSLFVDVRNAPASRFSVVGYPIWTTLHSKSDVKVKTFDYLFVRKSSSKDAWHFIVAKDAETLQKVSSPKFRLFSSLLSRFPEKVLITLFPARSPRKRRRKSNSSSKGDAPTNEQNPSGSTNRDEVTENPNFIEPCRQTPWASGGAPVRSTLTSSTSADDLEEARKAIFD